MENMQMYKKIIRQLLGTGDMETEQLVRIMEYQPDIIQAAKERANDLGTLVDWEMIIGALVDLTKDSIDYDQIQKEVDFVFSKLSSNELMSECEQLEEYINSIVIDNNGCSWGEIANACDSKYSDAGDIFKLLLEGEKSLDDFYEDIAKMMVDILKEEYKDEELDPIGVYTVSNNMAINIYKIDADEDIVLAGVTWNDAEECPLEGDMFKFGEIEISLDECIRL